MFPRLRSFLTAWMRRKRFEDGLADEVRFHLDAHAEDLIRSGVPGREAVRRARLHFGSVESMKDDCRHARGLRLADELRQDIRYALRGLRRNPLFAWIAIASLALGIGANTAIFSFVDATVDLGFDADRVVALRADPSASGRSGAQVSATWDEMLARARALPGVTAASLASSPPHGTMSVTMAIEVPGYVPGQMRGDTVVGFNFVSSGYFETLGQPVIRGRDFDERDGRGRPPVAIVNETFVEHFFDGRNPIGRRFRQGREELEIVGVVADSRDQAIGTGPADTVYVHEKQGPPSGMTLLVRAGDDPESIVPSLLAMIGSIDRRMPVASVRTLDADVEAGISSERMLGYLSTLFAALTLLLAGIGLYGVLASAVVRRTREIGLRLALGARRSSVVLLVGREGAALLIAGVAVGGFLAFAGGQVVRGVLFGVTATDPLTMAGSLLVLSGVALAATAIPLRRVVRVDPMVALRSE